MLGGDVTKQDRESGKKGKLGGRPMQHDVSGLHRELCRSSMLFSFVRFLQFQSVVDQGRGVKRKTHWGGVHPQVVTQIIRQNVVRLDLRKMAEKDQAECMRDTSMGW